MICSWWKQGQSGNTQGRRIKADDDWLPGETQDDRAKRRNRERAAKWRRDNPDRVKALSLKSSEIRKENWDDFLAYERARYARDPAKKLSKQQELRSSDPTPFRERCRRHYQNNKEQYVARVAGRRADRLMATPPWVDKRAILAFYVEARRLTKLTGIPHEVDHIHPLRGKKLCGLHVPWNLQIITRSQNRAKHNRLILAIEPETSSLFTTGESSAGLAL